MAVGCRGSEAERNWFRSDRIYNTSGKWYFTTREGSELGPFKNYSSAEKEAKLFTSCVQKDGLVQAQYIINSRHKMRF